MPMELPVTEAEKQPHKLERKWSFWFDNQSKPKQQGAVWGASLRKAYTFDTVEDFWGLHETIFKPSKLTANAEIHLFKAGVEPKWEDPECANGGKWTWIVTTNRKEAMDKGWLETLMALIGEQFDEADEICGVVASVRPNAKQDKLSLWTRTKSNEAILVCPSKKEKCTAGHNEKMVTHLKVSIRLLGCSCELFCSNSCGASRSTLAQDL